MKILHFSCLTNSYVEIETEDESTPKVEDFAKMSRDPKAKQPEVPPIIPVETPVPAKE